MIEEWKKLCKSFTLKRLINLLRLTAPDFMPQSDSLSSYLRDSERFSMAEQIGVIEYTDAQTVIAGAVQVKGELTDRSSKREQYDLAKRILKSGNHNAGIFIFYDDASCFRLSLITVAYHGMQRQFSSYRRHTFFVDPRLPNKTFLQQMGRADFSDLAGLLETFSLEAVSNEFYKEFKPKFDALSDTVQGTDDKDLKQDFALLFAIRIIFLGFVQKKEWLGGNPKFLQCFWQEYLQSGSTDTFYREWLNPLFFEALSSPPGGVVAYGHAPFSQEIQTSLQMAPYLNGELFKQKQGVDDQGLSIPDQIIGDFFDFLFQYNFTVEENELFDEELELNPEFLGIIFERLTNMDQGAVYTPRVEVDLMCRLALIQWLEQTTKIDVKDLYHLFFRDSGAAEAYDEHQRQGDFSTAEIRILVKQLERVTICDPAAGSGAFEVGMLQVLEQTLANLYSRNNTPAELKAEAPAPFERKKAIIANSLYGAEVKRWAVWINHLRLWLALFVDMPQENKSSFRPLLPNLTFKVRTGDSLVQRIGDRTFPVQGHADLPRAVKHKINALKQKKHDFFYNKSHDYRPIEQEELAVYQDILNAEIAAKRNVIRNLSKPQAEQGVLSLPGSEQKETDSDQAVIRKRKKLEDQIVALQNQKKDLKYDRPFIWSIEFAEIFFERGGFDIIIGNPPYVRQEEITDPNGSLTPGKYKEALLEMVRLDFPEYFAQPFRYDRFKPGYKPSGRSDLYTYFFIRSLRLLNTQGVHVFICSNSWLDVGYGTWLQEFFLRRVPLYHVIDNHARRSFARADINTVITVAGPPGEQRENQTVRFVAFKRPFEEVVFTENLLAVRQAETIVKESGFRVFPITVGELLQEGSDKSTATPIEQTGQYRGDKWGGKYLRAPDIYFTILEKGNDKLVRLDEIADVRFGIKTGANDFFYLEPLGAGSQPGLMRVRNGAGWEGELEEELLKPVIKSPRECRSLVINPDNLKYRIFMCQKSKEELERTKASEYIAWGEAQGYPERSTLRSRRRWWDLGVYIFPDATWQKSVNDRHVQSFLVGRYLVDQRLYALFIKEQHAKNKLAISLNNPVFWLFKELGGRVNLGEGVLDTTVFEAQNVKVVKFYVESENISNVRIIKNVFTECGIDPSSQVPIAQQEPAPLPDRIALDDIVFDALNLTSEERKEVYRAVCQLVWERISKARSVKRSG